MNTTPLRRPAPARRAQFARALFVAAALLALSYLANAQAVDTVGPQARTRRGAAQEQEKPPTSHLRGRIVYDDTGRPVRRARVLLLEDGSSEGTGDSALTNANGEFDIAEVKAGRYFIIVEGPGLLTPYSFLNVDDTQGNDIDFNAFRSQFDEVTVDGRTDAQVQVRARRGGSITGKVTYENGDPAINVTVTLLRRQKGRLRQFMGGVGQEAKGSVPTDDRGVYRFAGLPPGEYLVSVAEQIVHGDGEGGEGEGDYDVPAATNGGTPLVVTYYPAAMRVADAGSIKLDAGEEHNAIDITLVERGLYTLAGIVRDKRTGQPVEGVHLGIHLKEGEAEEMPLIIDHNTETDEQGHWQFNELPDGLYVLTVQPQQEADPAAMEAYQRAMRAAVESRDPAAYQTLRPPIPVQKFSFKQQEVTVEGHDLTNVMVEVSAGGYISGTVVIEDGKPLPPYMNIYAETQSTGTRAIFTSPTTVQNGRFILGGIQPGKVFFGINASNEEERFYVKSVTVNGVTYTRDPVPIEDGAVLKGARIVVATEMAKLHGRVMLPQQAKDKERAPAGGATVLLVSTDSSHWRFFDQQMLTRTNLDGTYELSAPPGDYLVFVLPLDERSRQLQEDEIKRFSVGAQHVTLRAGKTEQLELTMPEDK